MAVASPHGWPGAGQPDRLQAYGAPAGDLRRLLPLLFEGWCDQAPDTEVIWQLSGAVVRSEFAGWVNACRVQLQNAGLGNHRCTVGIHAGDGLANFVLGVALFLEGHCQIVLPQHALVQEHSRLAESLGCDRILSQGGALSLPGWCDQGLVVAVTDPFRVLVPAESQPRTAPQAPVRLEEAAFLSLTSGTTTGVPEVSSRTFHACLHYLTAGAGWLYFTPKASGGGQPPVRRAQGPVAQPAPGRQLSLPGQPGR